MNEEKLASNEVPEKFSEWLLAMGCPPENVRGVDKISEMCRGQYYIVWRSLMERVEAKDVIRNKRLQVFCDDMQKIRKKNVLESDTNTLAPEELVLWNRHTQLNKTVADSEARVAREKENLKQLTEHATSKLTHCNLVRKKLEETQRRAYFLQQLAQQLEEKKNNLIETKGIADSLCDSRGEDADVEGKLNKCISSMTRAGHKHSTSLSCTDNPVACSTATSSTSDHNDDEVLSSVARCRGEVLFKTVYEQRASLCAMIPAQHTDTSQKCTDKVQSVLCQTAALQSFVSLESIKNRVHVEKTREKLGRAFIGINSYLSPEECELLLTLCERACIEARVASLRGSKQEITSKSGAFATEAQPREHTSADTNLHAIDKAIECKRDELRRLITSVAAVERKTQNVKERLLVLFNGFHDNSLQGDRFAGRTSHPNESIATLRQFYEERREKHRNKVELSMNLDISDNCSFTDLHDGTPSFINELKLYLNKFHLEKNRTLVLESGAKIWIFETIASLLRELQTKWQSEDITTTLLSPAMTLKHNLYRVVQDLAKKEEMEVMVQALEDWKMDERDINITPALEEEQSTLDKIKKRLNENIINLQKTSKTLDVGIENLQFWANNSMKKYISDSRKINGVSFSCYEKAYLHSMM